MTLYIVLTNEVADFDNVRAAAVAELAQNYILLFVHKHMF